MEASASSLEPAETVDGGRAPPLVLLGCPSCQPGNGDAVSPGALPSSPSLDPTADLGAGVCRGHVHPRVGRTQPLDALRGRWPPSGEVQKDADRGTRRGLGGTGRHSTGLTGRGGDRCVDAHEHAVPWKTPAPGETPVPDGCGAARGAPDTRRLIQM